MKILVGDQDKVDFDEPIPLSGEQQQRFLNFLENELGFEVVKPNYSFESRTKRLGQYLPVRAWEREELFLLIYSNYTIETLMEKLGRTWMSINIPRGRWLLHYGFFEKKNKLPERSEESVNKFLDEHFKKKEQERIARKNESSLLECRKCGLLHDPSTYTSKDCFRCAEKTLSTVRVKKEEKKELYNNQKHFRYPQEPFLKEFFEKYPRVE